MSVEHGWVVCSPSDPTDEQWDVAWAIAGDDDVCLTRWNADTGDVIAEMMRDNRNYIAKWLIKPNGDADLMDNESEESQ
jgi:hypothetical protein